MVNATTVVKFLGHPDAGTLWKTYTHVLPEDFGEAVAIIRQALQGPGEKPVIKTLRRALKALRLSRKTAPRDFTTNTWPVKTSLTPKPGAGPEKGLPRLRQETDTTAEYEEETVGRSAPRRA